MANYHRLDVRQIIEILTVTYIKISYLCVCGFNFSFFPANNTKILTLNKTHILHCKNSMNFGSVRAACKSPMLIFNYKAFQEVDFIWHV